MKTVAILWYALMPLAVAADMNYTNVDELQEDDRPVSPERLTALIGEADRVLVTESPQEGAKKLFESREKKELDALSVALVVTKPDEGFHCMCIGSPALFLYKGDQLLVQITNHHGQSVRCSLWSSDAPVANIENWLKWFDDRQIGGPRKEVEEMRRDREQGERDWRKWTSAVPGGLETVWEDSLGEFGEVNAEPLIKALEATIPKKEDQILALFKWFGSGK